MHVTAIAVALFLLAIFMSVTWVYARHGHDFVEQIYRTNQLHRAQTSSGYMVAVHLRDYLRVDPRATDVRGELVKALIDFGRFEEALDEARAGMEMAADGGEVLARIILARALIATGDLGGAERETAHVVRTAPGHPEARLLRASIDAAIGDMAAMREEFALMAGSACESCTTAFRAERDDAVRTLELMARVEYERLSDPETLELARALLVTGDVDAALALYGGVETYAADDIEPMFWRGVHEESAGRPDQARLFYARAAAAHYSLGKIALERLQE